MNIKNTFSLSIALLFFLGGISAQEATTVKEKSDIVGEANGNALYVNVYRAEAKTIIKKLKSELKDKSEDVKIKGLELSALKASFPLISDSALTIYANTEEVTSLETYLQVIFLDEGVALSSENNLSGYNSAKAFLYELANTLSLEASEEYLETHEKELKKLEKELKDLKRKKEKDEKDILNLKKDIKKYEMTIAKLDHLEKLDEKAINDRSRSEKGILSAKEKIKDNEYDITLNKKEQEKTSDKIKKQKDLVKDAKVSLSVFK
jgi:hypothetical protein